MVFNAWTVQISERNVLLWNGVQLSDGSCFGVSAANVISIKMYDLDTEEAKLDVLPPVA